MKSIKCLLALLLCLAGAGNVWADHRGHARIGVFIGPSWGPGYYAPYYPPYYAPYYPSYYPPVVVERAPPSVYIEQPTIQQAPPESSMAPAAPQTNYWYYCQASKAYYPYVKECPGGWQKELPQPQGQP